MMHIFGSESNRLTSHVAEKASQKNVVGAAVHLLVPRRQA